MSKQLHQRIIKKNGCGFSKFPMDLFKNCSTSVTTIDLSGNKIIEIPSLEKMKSLVGLILISNKINHLPKHLFNLVGLKKLNLSQNILHDIPPQISSLTNLTTLILSQNLLTEIPESISQLTNLKMFSISTNKLSTLPNGISKLTSLTNLEIDHNNLQSLPICVCELESLLILNISGNPLHSLPIEITKLKSLKTLTAQYNSLEELPTYLSSMSSLINLDVDHNQLTSIQFNNSNSVRSLTFGDLSIKSLSLQNMVKLSSLSIHSGNIAELGDFPKMEIFEVENVHLKELQTLPQSVCVSLTNNNIENLPTLNSTITNITLKKNKISSLPSLCSYPLHRIDLSENNLTSVPDFSTTVRTLLIASNNLVEWPHQLSEIVSLRHLDLSHNSISFIPDEEISTLTNLDKLVLHYNYLYSLPKSIYSLPKLKLLGLNHNRLVQFPQKLSTTITSLMLASNAITVIPTYISKLPLLEIDISSNQIITLAPLFKNNSLKEITSCYNDIKFYPEELNSMTHLQRVNISGYPLKELNKIDTAETQTTTVVTLQRENGLITLPLKSKDDLPTNSNSKNNPIVVGLAECKGYRDEMQDFMCFIENFMEDGNHLAIVCDGHSGSVTAQICCTEFMPILRTVLIENQDISIKDALVNVFLRINKNVIDKGIKDGTTCLCMSLIGNDYINQLTNDHRPTNVDEYCRIRENGGYVIGNRTNGGLAITRSLGDSLSQPIVCPTPEVCVHLRRPTDRFIVLACDGVWDVLSNEKVCDIVETHSYFHPTTIANSIKDMSLSVGSCDNISCIVCKLN
ncbi:PH domain leucine-rich repeat-containing protein phosphatase [Entamoeba marina]